MNRSTQPSWAKAPTGLEPAESSAEQEVNAALNRLEENNSDLISALPPPSSFSPSQTLRLGAGYQQVHNPTVAVIPTNSAANTPRVNGNFEQITSIDAERILNNETSSPSANTPPASNPLFSRSYISSSVERWRNNKRRRVYFILAVVLVVIILIAAISIAVVRSRAALTRSIEVLVDIQPPCPASPVVCKPEPAMSMGWLRTTTVMYEFYADLASQWKKVGSSGNPYNTSVAFAYNGGPIYYVSALESNKTFAPNITGPTNVYDQVWSPEDIFEVHRVELIRPDITDRNYVPMPFRSLFVPPADPANHYDPKCVSLGKSPLGIAMWKSMATALGWPDRSIGWTTLLNLANSTDGWGSVSDKLKDFGSLKLGMGHYEFVTSARLALYAQIFAFAGNLTDLNTSLFKDPKFITAMNTFYSSVVRYDSDDSLLLDIMTRKYTNSSGTVYGQSYLHAVITHEYNVIKYNQVRKDSFPSGDSLVFILPSEGTYWSEFPLCVLDNLVDPTYAPSLRTEMKRFTDYVRSDAIQNSNVLKRGIRPISTSASTDLSKLSDSPFTIANGVNPVLSVTNSRQLPVSISNDIRGNATTQWQASKLRGVVCLVLDLDRLQPSINTYLADSLSNWFFRMNDNTDVYIVQVNGTNVEMWPPGPNGNVTLGEAGIKNNTNEIYSDLFLNRVFNFTFPAGDVNNITMGTHVLDGINRCVSTLVDVRTRDLAAVPVRKRTYHLPILTEGRDSQLVKLDSNGLINEVLKTPGSENIVFYPSLLTYRDIPADKMPNLRTQFQALADRTYGYSIVADDTFELFTILELATRMF
ncbi:hypothetical protein HK098_003637 [Nowakowskiella sp. JEL0407]|nr:hypothetical protein HK098_003637 [Nowakowskiella sp. JEL0407]